MTDTGLPETPENFYFVVRTERGTYPETYEVALMERREEKTTRRVYPTYPWYKELWHMLTFNVVTEERETTSERLVEHAVEPVKYLPSNGPVTVLDAESIYRTAYRTLAKYEDRRKALAAREKFLGAYPPNTLDSSV